MRQLPLEKSRIIDLYQNQMVNHKESHSRPLNSSKIQLNRHHPLLLEHIFTEVELYFTLPRNHHRFHRPLNLQSI